LNISREGDQHQAPRKETKKLYFICTQVICSGSAGWIQETGGERSSLFVV